MKKTFDLPPLTKMVIALLAIALLAGCGGGGGGGSSLPSGVNSLPTAAPTAGPESITGKIVDYSTSSGLAGVTITVGSLPTTSSCALSETQTTMPCAVPATPLPTVTTAADGSFTVANVQTVVSNSGQGMLTASAGSTRATLHVSFTASGTSTNIGTYKLTSLTTDEQNWLTDLNTQRSTVSSPTSFGNLVIDEYAEEQARQWATDCAAGSLGTCGDSSYSAYGTAYSANTGAMYGVAGVLCQAFNSGQWAVCDNTWMAEKANCPSGDWQTCTFAGNTGHYINISNTVDTWVGVGESASQMVTNPGFYAYDVMIIEDPGTGPASALLGHAL